MQPSTYGPFPYLPITRRKNFRWPGGAGLALWVIPNIEFFHLDHVMPGNQNERVPAGHAKLPNVRNWAYREYGNRVGVWRLMEVLARYGIRGTAALNSHTCDYQPEIVEAMTRSIGLDQPIWVQYGRYLAALASGDMGISRATFRPVADDVFLRLPATLELVLFAMIIVVAVAVPLGIAAAVRRGSLIDRFAQLLAQLGASVPGFWFGLVLIFLLFAQLRIAPAPLGRLGRFDIPPPSVTGLYTVDSLLALDGPLFLTALRNLILPAVTLGLVTAGVFIRLVRVNVIRTMKDDYIEAARARGIDERSVVYQHAFRNALVPVITVVGLTVALLLSGAILTETTFNWPGLGLTLFNYLGNRDYTAVQGIVILFALVVVFASLVIDFVNAYIDPRIRY